MTGKCATHLEHPLAKCQADTGGKQQVILLEAWQGIAEVAVAVSDLPTKPVLQLGGGSGVELEAVGTGVRDVGVEAELLGEGGAIVDFGVEGFADVDFAGLASDGRPSGRCCSGGDGAEEVLVEVTASKEVEDGGLCFDDVIAEAAADDVAQIEILELVVLEIGETKDEDAVADVEVAADATTDGVGGGGVNVVDGAVGVNGGGVDGDFVAFGDARSFAGERIGERLGITAGEAEAGVE